MENGLFSSMIYDELPTVIFHRYVKPGASDIQWWNNADITVDRWLGRSYWDSTNGPQRI